MNIIAGLTQSYPRITSAQSLPVTKQQLLEISLKLKLRLVQTNGKMYLQDNAKKVLAEFDPKTGKLQILNTFPEDKLDQMLDIINGD